MKISSLAILITALLASCGQPERPAEDALPQPPRVAAVTTPPAERGGIVNAAFWIDPATAGRNLILAAAGSGGVDFYTAEGERAGNYDGVDVGFVAVLDAVTVGEDTVPLILVYDLAGSTINAYRLDRDTLELLDVMPEPLAVADELTGLCQYRSSLSGSNYVFVTTDGGVTLQFELFERDGKIEGQLLRKIPIGKDSGFCAVDAREGMLYVSEEGMGIWRMGAEPESDTVREPVDLRAPWGNLSDEVKGIGIYQAGPDASYLIAADAGESRLAVYKLPDLEAAGTVIVEGLVEAEGLAATNQPFGTAHQQGLVAIADEDESEGGTDVKLVAWQSVAGALNLHTASGATTAMGAVPKAVKPILETEPVDRFGDAADDSAIWVNPDDPSRSLVIGTNKKQGLYVYDLEGRKLQTLPDGNMNNVDLRYDFPLGGERVALVAASNRSTDGISIYKVDADAMQLVEAGAGILPTGFADPYGLCMYRSASSGEYYVFINEGGDGTFRQWRLFDNGEGKVAVEQLREFAVGSQAEGCVADDEFATLYIAEEDHGLWKYSAEPDGGADRVLIDSTGDDGRLTDDVEGVALWIGAEGRGYLVASNQGADNYAVYRREGDNEWVGFFHVIANAELGIDGASETDGLDVTSAPLGDRYPAGLLVVQDGRNIAPEERQNFKFVSWQDVARVLGVE